jgi:hypothetical protein
MTIALRREKNETGIDRLQNKKNAKAEDGVKEIVNEERSSNRKS